MAALTGPAQAAAIVSELCLPPEPSRLRTARRHVEGAAARIGLDAEISTRFVYAVNEAVTNAIRHGAPDRKGLIRLRTVIEKERLTVHVHDSGTFAMPAAEPDPHAENGRGFTLMARFADEVRLSIGPGATVVSLSVAVGT